jgi:predicted DNA-binding transcriptional regulator YafY
LWLSGDQTQRVIVDFDARARPYIEARVWHSTQTLRKLPDGGVRVEIDVADTTQVVSWVLSWGPLARIRGPEALVARVRDDAAAACARYAD